MTDGESELGKAGLKEIGLKITAPRLKIYEILQSGAHMTAEDIHERLGKKGSLATVYRVLKVLEQERAVSRIVHDDRAYYELNRDRPDHDHLICSSCLNFTEFVSDEMKAIQQAIALKHDFEIHEHALMIYGKCKSCQESDTD